MDIEATQKAVEVGPEMSTWAVTLLGAMGAVTRVCLLRGGGEPLNLWQIAATLISGTVFSATGSSMVAAFVPGLPAFSVGTSAYVAGMLGMVLADFVVKKGTSFTGKDGTP